MSKQTGFIIDNIVNTGTRFQIQITYYYEYDRNTQLYTNSQIYVHDLPITEFNCNAYYDNNSQDTCELNGKNKCFFRYTNDMYDMSGQYNNPLSLYQYIVNTIL